MTHLSEPYAHARSVEMAIKEAAKKAAILDSSADVSKRIQFEYFNRFLSRIFSEGEASEWVLKGGAGVLARIPSTRSTRDIDLFRQAFTLDQALADLRRLAAVDLGDHFRFEYAGHERIIGTEAQPYTDGYRVTFEMFIGVASRNAVQVDLVVGADVTDEVQALLPATALDLPRLTSHRYRLYPVVDQIADKVCAVMSDFGDRTSSRDKDLVDLVIFAATQNIPGAGLSFAIEFERLRRKMEKHERFTVPPSWGPGYAKLSKPVPYCADYPTVELGAGLVSQLINPALSGLVQDKTWLAAELQWQ